MCCTPLFHAALETLPRLAHCDRVRVHLGSHKRGSECVCVRPLLAHWLVPAAEHDLSQGKKWHSKCPAEGIKGLIQLLGRSVRKGTAELTYRNRDMGSKLGRLNWKFGGSWELCSRIWESCDSNLNRVTGYSDRIFVGYFLHLRKTVVDYPLAPRPVLQTGTCLLLITKSPPPFHSM